MLKTTSTLAALTAALALGAAAPASADSLVFVKDHDVWLSHPDGSGQYRVTTDGTAENPYRSPSQADDGTIVTMRAKPNGAPMIRMRQNGEVLNLIPPGSVQAGPFAPHVSPDGRHVAFEIAQWAGVNDYIETATDARVVAADGSAPGQYQLLGTRAGQPSWLDSGTVLVGAGPIARFHAVGGAARNWWSDYDHFSVFADGEDLFDGETAGGSVVMLRGYDRGTMQLYRSNGPDYVPSPTCTFRDPAAGPNEAEFADPTLSPAGDAMAWQEGDGIWTAPIADIGDCASIVPRLLIAGASEPDWGPANVNPGPRASAPAPAPAPAPPVAPRPVVPAPKPAAKSPSAKVVRPGSLRDVGKGRLKLEVSCPGACTVRGRVTVDRRTAKRLGLRLAAPLADATRRLKKAGRATIVLRPRSAVARRLARLSKAKLTVAITTTGADRVAKTTRTTLALKR